MPHIVGWRLIPKKDTENTNQFTEKLIQEINYEEPFIQLICFWISTSCFIHNLYAQYQHNKSLEAQLKVEIDGEVKTINASPNYFDAYTTYNILETVASLNNIIGIGIGSERL